MAESISKINSVKASISKPSVNPLHEDKTLGIYTVSLFY